MRDLNLEIKDHKPKKSKKFWLVLILIILIVIISIFIATKLFAGTVAQTYLDRGYEYLGQHEYSKAMQQFETAGLLKNIDGRTVAESFVAQGDIYMLKGDFDQAEKNYLEAIDQDKKYAEAYIRLGDVYFDQGKYTSALDSFRESMERGGGEQAQIGMLKSLMNLDQFEDAANYITGTGYYVTLYEAVNNLESFKVDYQNSLSETQSEAAKSLIAKESGFDNEVFHDTALGKFFIGVSENNLAYIFLQKAVQADDSYRDALVLKGLAEVNMGDFDQALQTLSVARDLDPTFAQVYYVLAKAYTSKGEYKNSIRDFNKAINLGYATADLYIDYAETLVANENYQVAKNNYLTAWDKADNDDREMIYKKTTWLELDDHADFAGTKISRPSETSQDYALEGLLDISRGDLDQAKVAIDKSQELDDHDSLTYYAWGKWYEANNDNEKARSSFDRALDLDLTGEISKRINSK